jgi:hypothetical protein
MIVHRICEPESHYHVAEQYGIVLLPLPALQHICILYAALASAACSVLVLCDWSASVCIAGRPTLTCITGELIAVGNVGISCLAFAVLTPLTPGTPRLCSDASLGACRYFQRFRGRKLNFLEIGIQVQDSDVPTSQQPGPICTSQHSPATRPAHSCPVSLTAFRAVQPPPLLPCLATQTILTAFVWVRPCSRAAASASGRSTSARG